MEVLLLVGTGLVLAAGVFMMVAAHGNASPSPGPDQGRLGLKEGPLRTEDRVQALLATVSGRPATVYRYTQGEYDAGLRLAVEGLCPSVTFWRHEVSRPQGSDARAGEGIGDPGFDAAFRVSGSRPDTLALLTAATRSAIRDLLLGNVRIAQLRLEDGTLTTDVPTTGFAREHPGLDQVARKVAELSMSVRPPPDVVARLAENATQDPEGGVRLQSLRALLDAYEPNPRTRETVRAALADRDPRVRLEAALASGATGNDALVALAVDLTVEEACSARALDALGPLLPLDRVEPLVREAAHGPTDERARPVRTRAFVTALGRNASPPALEVLARLVLTADDAYAAAIVDAVVADGRPNAESALIPALGPSLESRPHGRARTREAAARRLGAVGTVDAVLPLQEAAERHGGTIASSARRSIAEIQARLAGSPGRLALTNGEAGRLSPATDVTGRVSQSPDED